MEVPKYKYIVIIVCLLVSLASVVAAYADLIKKEALVSVGIPFQYVLVDGNGPDDLWQKSAGDINGDGLPDLIAGGHNGGGLVWYESPTWTKHTIASGGGHSTDGEVADVNGDDKADYVGLTASALVWYENPGWTVHTIDNRVLHDVEVADFDNDKDMDIVARDQGEFGHSGETLHFYRQDTATSWTHYEVNIANGEGLVTANVDGDEYIDVVIGGFWFENDGVIVNGGWHEHAFTPPSWNYQNTYVAAGDINGDGRLDIVLSPAELAGQTYRISWFEAPENPKDSNWTEHIIEDNVEAVHHFAGIADFNNDGLTDVAAAEMHQGANPDEVKIYINDGDGLSWTKQVLATTGSHSMRLLDVENDGDIDLYGANWVGNDVELWQNETCDNVLDQWERHVIDDAKAWQSVFIDATDLNGDTHTDIVTGGWWYQNPGTPGGSWTRNTIGTPLNNMSAIVDFDGDGDLDILGTQGQGSQSNDSFVWARNDGAGNFTIFNNIANGNGDFLQGVAVGDFQAGANRELFLSWHEANKGIQRLTLPANSTDMATQTWEWDQVTATSQDEDLSSGDIDGDGDLDLLLGTIWLRNDDPDWSEFVISNISENPDRNELVDMNGDKRLDAVVGFEAISQPGLLAWYEQGAAATNLWTQHVISDTIIGPMSLDVADMDFDGDPDIVVGEHNLVNPSSARLFVFENTNGDGTSWETHLVYEGDEHHDGAQLTDIDGDGDLDIISIGWGHGRVVLYENKAPFCHNLVGPYTLDVVVTGNGSVTIDPQQDEYSAGQVVTLTAVPENDWIFAGWGDDLSGFANPETLTITGDTTVSADFIKAAYTLDIAITGNGAVNVEPQQNEYSYGQVVTLTAVPENNWTFAGWGADFSGLNNPEILTITDDTAVSATFINETYTLDIAIEGNGAVNVEPQQSDYRYGQVVTLTAVPENHWVFDGWGNDLSGFSNPKTLTITGDTIVSAVFSAETYTLDIAIEGNGAVNVEPQRSEYRYGQVVTLTAVPDNHWVFDGWGNDLSGLSNPKTLTITGDTNVSAVFSPETYTLDIAIEGNGAVDVEPQQSEYRYEQVVTLTAVPENNWTFNGWGNDLSGLKKSEEITILGDTVVYATFTLVEYRVFLPLIQKVK